MTLYQLFSLGCPAPQNSRWKREPLVEGHKWDDWSFWERDARPILVTKQCSRSKSGTVEAGGRRQTHWARTEVRSQEVVKICYRVHGPHRQTVPRTLLIQSEPLDLERGLDRRRRLDHHEAVPHSRLQVEQDVRELARSHDQPYQEQV